jgi:enoyl-CoA hydratase/carnithine racemase
VNVANQATAGDQPHILVHTDGKVGVVTLNRPQARNALNLELLTDLHAALERLDADPAVHVVVLTGNGPAFCAGADLKETARGLAENDFWSRYERATKSMGVHALLPRMRKPVIAAVNGYAVAGGCGLAMSCDLVVASDQAQFGYPEVGRGLVAAMVMVTLSRLVNRRQALDLLLTGRRVPAAEALELGLINRVVPHDELMARTLEYAEVVAGNSPSALRVTKYLLRQVSELDSDRAIEYARDVNQMIRQTADARRGVADFSEAKAPGGSAS